MTTCKAFLATAIFAATFTALAGDIEITSHRGEPTLAPQNSVASIKLAYEVGAKRVETDFWRTDEGDIICVHDSKALKKLSGNDTPIEKLTRDARAKIDLGASREWGEKYIGTRVPTLEEIVALVPDGCRMEAEIKRYSDDYAKRFDAAIKKAGKKPKQFIILSFDVDSLEDFHKKFPQYYITINYSAKIKDGKISPSIKQIKKDIRRTGAKCITMGNSGKVPQEYLDAIKAEGVKLQLWIVDSVQGLIDAKKRGADIITTNRADALKAEFKLVKETPLK